MQSELVKVSNKRRITDRGGAGGILPTKATAPGRVNLIGEHTDYNSGWVMPVAIDLTLEVELTRREDRLVTAIAAGFDNSLSFNLDYLEPVKGNPVWIDYVGGVCWALMKNGYALTGADLSIRSTIPIGAGLSSSAALELAVAGAFAATLGYAIDPIRLALICQQAENEFVGVRCGIMDQFAVALGRRGEAILLDCRALDYSYIPFCLGDLCLLIVDSRVKRSLDKSAYNRRREECEEAVFRLGKHLGRKVDSLRDIGLEEVKSVQTYLPEKIYKRSRYVVEENTRVIEASTALQKGDFRSFGYFLNRSHAGLRYLYEVSTPELDLIVDLATAGHKVLGARMTGAGFGGCAIVLLHQAAVEEIRSKITGAFEKNGWLEPHYYLTRAANGLTIEC